MHRCYRFWVLRIGCGLAVLLAGLVRADNFTLTDGKQISGELVSPDEKGAMIRLPDDSYAEVSLPSGNSANRIPWSRFSQDDLKRIMAKDKRAAAFAEPWIDVVPVERTREKEFTVKPVARLWRPAGGSFLVGFASSGPGQFILVLLYLANLYAAYEIALVRAQSWPLVCGLAAVAPILGPVLFLCLPTRLKTREQEEAELHAAEQAAEQAAALQAATAATAEAEPSAGGLGLAARTEQKPEFPATQTFTRGQFTFNRRFFETKFANFFGVVRREVDKDMLLVFKTARGQFSAERISRIAANDLHLQVRRGAVTEEHQVPFVEIQEIVLKHKDAA